MTNIDIISGLTSDQVQSRIDNKQTNDIHENTTKSIKSIIFSNVFTLFNGVNVILALLVFYTGQYSNALFMGVIICNTLIGIFQEIRAKLTIDKLKLINDPYFDVIRDSKVVHLDMKDIVLDDILMIKAGQQVPADGILRQGNLEVNESMLTGESDTIKKHLDDHVLSGSIVLSGNALIQVEHVGKDNYIDKILIEAKQEKKHRSMLQDDLNLIIKTVSFLIFPVGILLFTKQYFFSKLTLNESILSTVAALIGMIPEGLILLTSVSLALGALALIKKNTLTNELYSLETLARVDMLCLDKTGTLTQGKMSVEKIIGYNNDQNIENILANMMADLKDENSTAIALNNYCKVNTKYHLINKINFSSERKFSACSYSDYGTFILGAYDFIKAKSNTAIQQQISELAKSGKRVLTLVHNDQDISTDIPADNVVIAIIVLSDMIRPTANQTLQYFDQQGVSIKIISGDDFQTVCSVAAEAGVKDANLAIDTYGIDDQDLIPMVSKYNVFGRVTPHQKQLMIQTLKNDGNIVAMVGDGVNDVMALKTADCSIAMKDGADATKSVANLVLLDNDFSNMPAIVNQGRRVINNIQTTATLFLSKTVFSVLLSFLTLLVIKEYPFYPIQLTLISSFLIGFPSFVMTLEPNYRKVTGRFLVNIFAKAIPAGLSIVITILIYEILKYAENASTSTIATMIVISTILILLFVLVSLLQPFNKLRIALLIAIIIGLLFNFIFLNKLFLLEDLTLVEYFYTAVISFIGIMCLKFFDRLKLNQLLSKIKSLNS